MEINACVEVEKYVHQEHHVHYYLKVKHLIRRLEFKSDSHGHHNSLVYDHDKQGYVPNSSDHAVWVHH
jgi:hypothetical protein